MKLIYISNSKLPTNLAHGLQIMQMCSAFAKEGHEVELLVPFRVGTVEEDPFSYYGVEKNFKITKIPSADLLFLAGNRFIFLLQLSTFLAACRLKLLFGNYDAIYSREPFIALFFKNVVLEIHSLPKTSGRIYLRMLKRAKALCVLTPFIKERAAGMGIDARKILVVPDAVNMAKFDIILSKGEARSRLGLPESKKLIGYVGMLRTLGMEKGIDVAIDALKNLETKSPSDDVRLVLVGGYPEDIAHYKKLAESLGVGGRVIFTGMVRHDLVPIYLKAFDILIAPFPETEHYSFYMSPLKIFEYMASGRPIISTTLPSLREVLDSSNSLLTAPGSSSELAGAIRKILSDPEFGSMIAERAKKDVGERYTWQKRAHKILDFIDPGRENVRSFSSDSSVKEYSRMYLRAGEGYVIKKYMSGDRSVLDLGCGAGRTTIHIYDAGANVIGVDIAAPLIEEAKKNFPQIDFRVMDARRLDFGDGTFDTVFFSFNGIDNMTSLEDREKVLIEMKRVLKPGGYLIYTSHNGLAIPRTKTSFSIIRHNLGKLRIGPHWRNEEYEFGRLTQYYNNIWNEVFALKLLGFRNIETVGNSPRFLHAPKLILSMVDKFPIYIAQK